MLGLCPKRHDVSPCVTSIQTINKEHIVIVSYIKILTAVIAEPMILAPRVPQLYRTIIQIARARNMPSSTSKSTLLMSFSPKANPEVKIPKLIYGTAWKKERTAGLVYEAIKAGFRAIDTAAQPRHYREDLVCEGIKRAIDEGIVTRKELHVNSSPSVR